MNRENDDVGMEVDGSLKHTLMQQGAEHYRAKRYQEALAAYEEAIQLDPNDTSAYVGKGDSLRQLRLFKQSFHTYEQAHAIDLNNTSAYVGKSYALLELGEINRATLAYQKALQLDHQNASVYNVAGLVFCRQARFGEAIKAFEEAIRLARADNNIAGFYNNKGIALRELKRYQEALAAFTQALELDPSNNKYHSNIFSISKYERFKKANDYCDNADELSSQRRYEEALWMFNKALRIDPDHIRADIGRGNALFNCHCYHEALLAFNQHLQIYPRRVPALLGKGKALYKLNRYEEALKVFQQVLLLDNQLVQAFVDIGHTYLALSRPEKALRCYEKAIGLHTDDVTCYISISYILINLQCYEKVIRTYEEAFQCFPGIVSAYLKSRDVLLKLVWFWPFLAACGEIIKRGTTEIAPYLSIQDTLTTLGLHDTAAEAHEKAMMLALMKNKQDSDQLWALIFHPQTSRCPAHIQFELFQQYIMNAPAGSRSKEVFQRISSIYPELFEIGNARTELFQSNLQTLYIILLHIPEEKRAEALTLIVDNDDIRIAQLLIYLAPFSLPGLAALAHQVTLRWVVAPRNDDLVIRFYHVLDSYSVPFEDSDWLFVQELMLEGLYIQVKSVLSALVKQRPAPERLWLLAEAMWHRHDPAQEQIEILHQFIASTASSDTRCGEAWKRIGELSLEKNEGIAAIAAFQEAERFINSIPQLELYRTGDWNALRGLHLHPDFAFPVVVVVDLECDYQPDAADGSRVFEIAAVRRKGHTELDTCSLVIKRDFPTKVTHRQNEAVEPEQAACLLQKFIGSSIVVGHNLQGFDVKHLRGMDIEIDNDQIIDTLSFARLLYPDSVHHHLALLCDKHNILPQGEWHTALADARACADLLYVLGDELVRRGGPLLAGFRAFVPPGRAFDRAVLQPRGVAVDPAPCPAIDPLPTMPYSLASVKQESASPAILAALEQHIDALVERYDPSGSYVQHLPLQQRTVVVVNSRTRLERMLAQSQDTLDLFVLPDPQTLLCPHRLRQAIEQTHNWQVKLALFCLYQASHNHDAQTLYPLRLPSDDPFFNELKQILLTSCCASDWRHPDNCPGMLAAKSAIENHRVLFATHESFLHQPNQPEADLIIVDDADKLQMRFAEYLAECVTSERIRAWSSEVFHLIDAQIARYMKEHISNPGLYERVPLQSIVPYLAQPQGEDSRSLLSTLQSTGHIGAVIAATLEKLCHQAAQEATTPDEIHAYWLEVRTARQSDNETWSIEQWSFCGLDKNLRQAFRQFFWERYKQHLICGTAITLGALKTMFLTRFFGLPENMVSLMDQRPASQIHIPSSEDIRPASFLGRRPWAHSIGNFLYRLVATPQRSVLVSIQTPAMANALTLAFKAHPISRQVLSPQLGWTTTKIADRLADETRFTMAFVPPGLRETVLDGPVDIEATGPLRFLNQQDPQVAAHLRLYAKLYPNENPFSSYLLPQALLELKTRVSSAAKIHIIIDSGLHSKVYRDEVCSLFQQDTLLDALPGISGEKRAVPDVFSAELDAALERWGLSSHTNVEDETLHLALQTYWGTDSFREAPLNQKEIVQAILDGSDQLVIAATGGGKSLCFQLPAILMAQEIVPKVTLIVSPLIALMQDQVEALKDKGVFSAIAWNSTLKPAERKNYLEGVKRGWYSIIYIAPEQIHSASLRKALAMREIGLIAIDEAHCVSQWGHDFRTAYIGLKQWIETQLCDGQKRTFPIIALTATARKGYIDSATGTIEQGTVQEIIENLGLLINPATVKVASLERPELEFSVERITLPCPHCQFQFAIDVESVRCPSCGRWCKVEEEQIEQAKVERLIALLAERDGQGLRRRWDRPYGQRQRGLIYCAYTRTTETIVNSLGTHPQLAGLSVQAYHGQMSDDVKERVYSSFIRDDGVDSVVATNAFGMGIDVRRLGFVIHFDIPGTLEAYIQEAGRAGRDPEFQMDGECARCILLYHERDLEKQRVLNKMSSIDEQGVVNVYEALRKFRSRGEREIFVTASEIKNLTDIGESKSQSILYYLERHTCANRKPLLERGENAQTEWLLSFEHGYEERIHAPALRVSATQLIDVFRYADAFRLQEREIRMIDGDDLADLLGWEKRTLLVEINNLMNRHILVHANHLLIRWLKSKDEAYQLITQLEQDVNNLLHNISDQQAFRNGKNIALDLERLHNEGNLSAVSLPTFTCFLDILSKNTAAPLQLFEHFERALSGNYELRLVPVELAKSTCQNIFRQLREVTQRYIPTERSDTWHVLDMVAEEEDYEQRHLLEQGLLVLAKLELLLLQSPQNHESAMRIMFKQDDVPSDQLEIDLSRLRLVKRHGERKLELMKAYATMPPEQRKSMLDAYFAGEAPLLEPFEMRSDLTEQQRAIVAITDGYYLVMGPAGSGKTTVLEEHIRYLVESMLVPHDHILVVTHFRSGVDRISNNVKVYQKNGKTIYARTLHNLGKAIFLQNRELLLRPDGKPYYTGNAGLRLLASKQEERPLVQEALEVLRQALELSQVQEVILQQKQYNAWLRSSSSTADKCLNDIARLRQYGIFPGCLIDSETLSKVLGRPDNPNWTDFVYDVYCRYLLLLGDRGSYTYDDQILFALVILKTNPDITRLYQWRYEHIIIDEFQDLAPAQNEIIGIFSQKHRNVVAFGDDAQDIRVRADNYQMPSPLVKRFQRISGKTLPSVYNLQTNFRSVQEILDVAGRIRKDVPQIAASGYRGEKPVVIRVNPETISVSKDSDVDSMLRAMVKAALDHREKLPKVDRGKVALMVAISGWSQIVQDYLRERQEPFTVLDNSRYQSQHSRRILTYYRLIIDDHLDTETEQLLSYCVAPNFHHWQIKRLKKIAQANEEPLLNTLKDNAILNQITISSEQGVALRQHLEIINTFGPESRFADVWQAISRLQEGPLAEETTEELQQEELEEILKNFRKQTVAEAMKDINRHISFLEEHRTYQQLIITSVDNAKSQAFDTVFLLGAQALNVNYPNHRARLYVSISRARQRFFFLVDERFDEARGDDALLPWLKRELHDKLLWLETHE